jgi:predicted permease
MPEWENEIRKRFARFHLQPEREQEIIEELSAHLQDRYMELRGQGVSDEKASLEALSEELDTGELEIELRRTEQARQEVVPGARSSGKLFFDFANDLRYAARMMLKSPGFSAVAALTLALGIGANTAVFTIVSNFILNPLPVEKISELAAVNAVQAKKTTQSGELQLLSVLNFKDFRERTRSFSNLAGHSNPFAVTMVDNREPHRIFAELVTANYFETLGIRPSMGRFFVPSEDVTPGTAGVAVLGYAAWRGRFGGAQDVVGRTIKLNDTPFTIIGIGPKGFKGVYAIFGPDVWVPSMMAAQILPSEIRNALSDRTLPMLTAIGRLRPGVTLTQAQTEMKIEAVALDGEYPDANQGQTVTLRPLKEAAFGPERQPLVYGSAMLMAIVGFVLLIACSNVANLLLARASARRQEIAVRMALGAGRSRLIRQLLTESVLLGLLGGVLGFVLGYAGSEYLWSLRPAEYALNLADFRMGANVFGFAFVIAILTGLVFGIMPALRTSRASVSEALKEEARTGGRSRGRVSLANALLAGQVAMSLVLLVITGLFLRSIQREYTIDPGFQTRHLALFMLYPGQAGYGRARTEEFYKAARDRISAVPGIVNVTWASNMPLWGRKQVGVMLEGHEQRRKSEAISAVVDTVDLDYFSTMGIPFVAGRDFTADDREIGAAVAIINDTMAAEYWPGQNALGKRLKLPRGQQFLQIVGIVKTTNYQSLGEPPQSCVYIPVRQNYTENMILYVRTEHDPSAMLSAVQSEIHTLDPGLAVEDVRTGMKIIDQALWWSKIGVGLLGVFGLLALALACVGLYGIMAYSVGQRRREIGVRMALGAGAGSIALFILRQGMTVVLSGVAVGAGLALLLGRVLSRFLYGVSGSDPISLAGSALVLLAVAFVACYLPARSASQVDPLVALRES